ncbi:phosphoglycerate mutase-like protein [Auriscalpium vulgare]|uniref:Phosphoglycerate mutase-like protein n=1 Tax=Auriscalpium vulgare TaxID=40419 RepID=A0ACB8S668_9AGAM|nr:phosphoglycerate mutase-like protein [Auriscalpium vulgare]
MSPMPRLIIVRHGETEWSLNGRHTGRTDIPLTARGEEQIKSKAQALVGDGKLIDTVNLRIVLVSPRKRAHRTFHLLTDHLPVTPNHIITESVREWDYGHYEGLLSSEIKAENPNWTIWNDGCPGGESVEDMTARVDSVIADVREYHRKWKEEGQGTRDVVIVAHGHFNRCLIARWMMTPLCAGDHLNVEPAGIAVLSYNHNSLDEPCLNALNLNAYA